MPSSAMSVTRTRPSSRGSHSAQPRVSPSWVQPQPAVKTGAGQYILEGGLIPAHKESAGGKGAVPQGQVILGGQIPGLPGVGGDVPGGKGDGVGVKVGLVAPLFIKGKEGRLSRRQYAGGDALLRHVPVGGLKQLGAQPPAPGILAGGHGKQVAPGQLPTGKIQGDGQHGQHGQGLVPLGVEKGVFRLVAAGEVEQGPLGGVVKRLLPEGLERRGVPRGGETNQPFHRALLFSTRKAGL